MPVTPEFFHFLVENRLHDSKAWFEEHRGEYERLVLEPLRGLVEEMTPTMLTIDPQLVTKPQVGKTISRIFRDTRFSRDKSAFREHLWISFSRGKRSRRPVPELFLDLGPEGYSYGCGWYCPGPELMNTFRKLLLDRDSDAMAAVRAMKRQDIFLMEGDAYKRPKHPDAPKELYDWVNRREVYFTAGGNDPDFLYAQDLGGRVAKDLTVLAPLYRFLWKAQNTADAEAIHPAAILAEW